VRDQVIDTFKHWLFIEDETPLDVIMASSLAIYFPGDPLWLLFVGPPGCLSYDEEVLVWNDRLVEPRTIKSLYHDYKTRGIIPEVITLISPDKVTTRPAIPIESGIKNIYEVITDKGTISASSNHIFFKIENGIITEKTLAELDIGDNLLYTWWYDKQQPYRRESNRMPDMPPSNEELGKTSSLQAQPNNQRIQEPISWLRGYVSYNQGIYENNSNLAKTTSYSNMSRVPETNPDIYPKSYGPTSTKIPPKLLSDLNYSIQEKVGEYADILPEPGEQGKTIEENKEGLPRETLDKGYIETESPGLYNRTPGGMGSSTKQDAKDSLNTRSTRGKFPEKQAVLVGIPRITSQRNSAKGQNDLARKVNGTDSNRYGTNIPVEFSSKNQRWDEVPRLHNTNLPSNSNPMRWELLAQGRGFGYQVGYEFIGSKLQRGEIFGEGIAEPRVSEENYPTSLTGCRAGKDNISVILDIRRRKRKATYDLIVLDTNNFVTKSGIVVHNSGKTEIVRAFNGDDIYSIESLTSRTLVSGLKEKKSKATQGILPDLNNKLLVIKDLTVMLQYANNPRPEENVFNQLRNAYDGEYAAAHGSGLKRQYYRSRFGLIAAVTPVVDKYRSLNASLGERFLTIRINQNSKEAIRKAQENCGKEEYMRNELRDITKMAMEFYKQRGKNYGLPTLTDTDSKRTSALGNLTAKLRSGVERDRNRYITVIPQTEIGTRLVKQFTRLGELLKLYGAYEYRKLTRVARDCINPIQLNIIRCIHDNYKMNAYEIHKEIEISHPTVKEYCENLWVLGICEKQTLGKNDKYNISPEILDLIWESEIFEES